MAEEAKGTTPDPHGASAPDSAAPVRGVGLADLCIRKPVFATMMNLLLVVLGLVSFFSVGIDQYPNVELPIVTVTTTLRGASPEEMETSVTKPLEEIINTVEGIDELSSVTREGVSEPFLVRVQSTEPDLQSRQSCQHLVRQRALENLRARGGKEFRLFAESLFLCRWLAGSYRREQVD